MATKGIAIYVPGADYSRTPFGQVILTPTVDEEVESIVSAYTTAIGSTTYATQLKAMVKSLINAGAWDGLDIYPMLGSTIEHQKVNLNPSNGFTKANLLFGTNATWADGGVLFERVASANADLPARTLVPMYKNSLDGLFSAADVIRTSGVTGVMRLYYTSIMFYSSSSGYVVGFGPYAGAAMSATSAAARHLFSFGVESYKANVYVDGVFESTSEELSWSDSFNIVNVIGCSATDAAAGSSWGGICRFWVVGQVDVSKHAAVNAAIKTFLDAVKPNA